MKGNLRDMTVADLIQHTCEDQKTARLKIQNSNQQAALYFKSGNLVHAILGDQIGEEVVYELLHWSDGSFNLEAITDAPKATIHRNWSGLLLEGARRFDEFGNEESNVFDPFESEQTNQPEVTEMAKFDEILKEMSGEVNGYVASALVGMDGINLAAHSSSKNADPEALSANLTMLLKLVDGAVEKLGAGVLEDDLVTADNAYLLMHFIPGKQYYLGLAASRKAGNLGNMRLISKVYGERLSKAMPR